MSANNVVMLTGNGNTKIHFLIVILQFVQQISIQLQLLFYKTKARAGTLFEKDEFDQLGCWQDYSIGYCTINS